MDATLSPVMRRSLERLAPFVDPAALSLVGELLAAAPCEIAPVRSRRSKHGDHRPGANGRTSRITVNVCGNRYQFLLTLLHELAHAVVAARHGTRVVHHGKQWKRTFGEILARAIEETLFPADLTPHLARQAKAPSSSSFRDLALQKALRRHDTLDHRPMVAELPPGTLFSLDGRRVFRLGAALRSCFRCVALDGAVYRVAATARVGTIYEKGAG